MVRFSCKGKNTGQVKLPTRMITCSGSVGKGVFVTSAEEEPEKLPQSAEIVGSSFSVDVGIEGAPVRDYIRRW